MARFKFTGVEELVAQFQTLGNETDEMVRRAVYNGAKVLADGLRQELQTLPVDDSKYEKDKRRTSVMTIQKNGLIHGLGVTPMKDDNGFINVKIGFDGCNNLKTKAFPNGQPNMMIARSLEAGTSYLERNPIITKTANKLKKKCEQAMQESLDRDIKAVTD